MAIEKAKILDVLKGNIGELEEAYAELEKTHMRLILRNLKPNLLERV